MPLYLLGRQLEDLFPIAFLPKGHALAVAIMSYNGGIDYGLLADFDAMPDIDVIAEGLDESLAELLTAAREKTSRSVNGGQGRPTARSAQPNGGPVSILPSGSARPTRGPAADMRAKRARRGGPDGERPQR
jgi:hypothetical protein